MHPFVEGMKRPCTGQPSLQNGTKSIQTREIFV